MAKLILAGGGNSNQSQNLDFQFLQLIDKNKPILYIPLAMKTNDNYQSCVNYILNTFNSFGFNNFILGNDLSSINELENYSAVYIGGGNTYHLLNIIKNTNFVDILEDFVKYDNGIIYGGSAGAIIFGDDIRTSNDLNEDNIDNFEGLNLLKGFNILPHWTNQKENRIKQLYSIGINRIICIPEDSGLIYDTYSKIGQVIGYIKIFDENEVKEYFNGQEIKF